MGIEKESLCPKLRCWQGFENRAIVKLNLLLRKMRIKNTVMSIAFILICSSASGQLKVNFGVKGAYSLTEWKWNVYPEPTASGYGITVGGFVDYHLHDKGWLRAEIDYSKYNFNLSVNNGYNVNFLEIPVTYNAKLYKGFSSYFGLGVGFKMSDNVYWKSSDQTLNQLPLLSNYKPEYFNTANIFFPVGVSYKFDFGMFFDLRMNLNMNDMGNSSIKFAKGLNTYNIGIGMNF